MHINEKFLYLLIKKELQQKLKSNKKNTNSQLTLSYMQIMIITRVATILLT